MSAADDGGGEDDAWDAASATVLESVEVDASPSSAAASGADAGSGSDAIDGPWNCGICGRSNRPEVAKCKLCGAARGRKPNPKIVNFVSKEERSRSASISSYGRSEYKVCAASRPPNSRPIVEIFCATFQPIPTAYTTPVHGPSIP